MVNVKTLGFYVHFALSLRIFTELPPFSAPSLQVQQQEHQIPLQWLVLRSKFMTLFAF